MMNIAKTAAHKAAHGKKILICGHRMTDTLKMLDNTAQYNTNEIKRIYKTNGQERIEYHSGGAVHTTSRGHGRIHNIRGLSHIDLLILDDHRPLQDPNFTEEVFPIFGTNPPRVSVIG